MKLFIQVFCLLGLLSRLFADSSCGTPDTVADDGSSDFSVNEAGSNPSGENNWRRDDSSNNYSNADILEILGKFESRISEQLTGVEQRLEQKITGVEQRLEQKIARVEQKMDGLEQNLTSKIDDLKETVLLTNAFALLDHLNPPVLANSDEIHDAILKGFPCTYTYIQRESKYYVVTAKHCVFSTILTSRDHPAFAVFPEEAVMLGIEQVGFSNATTPNEEHTGTDFVIAELAQPPNVSTIPLYPDINLSLHHPDCANHRILVVGRGVSGSVIGEGVALYKAKDASFFRTVMVSGEPGNSGTLLYSSASCGTLARHMPFGVFKGTYNLETAPRLPLPRLHGQITPLPPFDSISWHASIKWNRGSGNKIIPIHWGKCTDRQYVDGKRTESETPVGQTTENDNVKSPNPTGGMMTKLKKKHSGDVDPSKLLFMAIPERETNATFVPVASSIDFERVSGFKVVGPEVYGVFLDEKQKTVFNYCVQPRFDGE